MQISEIKASCPTQGQNTYSMGQERVSEQEGHVAGISHLQFLGYTFQGSKSCIDRQAGPWETSEEE